MNLLHGLLHFNHFFLLLDRLGAVHFRRELEPSFGNLLGAEALDGPLVRRQIELLDAALAHHIHLVLPVFVEKLGDIRYGHLKLLRTVHLPLLRVEQVALAGEQSDVEASHDHDAVRIERKANQIAHIIDIVPLDEDPFEVLLVVLVRMSTCV